jgi:hypothetical protein
MLRCHLGRQGFKAAKSSSLKPADTSTAPDIGRSRRRRLVDTLFDKRRMLKAGVTNIFRRIPWQDVCKFLAGAFFVNAGILFYLYLARVSVPILGTGFVETPEVSGVRSIVHAVLFSTFFYFGFIRKRKGRSINDHQGRGG